MIACPNCGGNVTFSIAAQQMSCEFCNSLFDPYSFDSKSSDAVEQQDFEATIFTCPQCGGEILSTDDASAGFCSFCGASTILYSRISHEKRPGYIIPFQITKDKCKESYGNLMKKAIFAPKELKDPSQIDGFRGIYMPYWAFHITQKSQFNILAKKEHRRGDYIITDHVNLKGDVDAYYKGLSYDASSSFADNISEALAPYDVKSMQPFTPGFFSGFYADTADVDATVYESEAISTAHTNTMNTITSSAAFSSYSLDGAAPTKEDMGTKVEAADYAMFPVWFMSYRSGDRVAYATVNGQNGKVVADIPIDPKKYLLGSLVLAIPLFIILNLFLTLTPMGNLIACAILAAITICIYSSELYAIKRRDNNEDDRGMLSKKPNGNINDLNEQMAQKNNSGKLKKLPAGIAITIAGAVIAALVAIIRPVFDGFYYGAAIIFLIAVFFALTDVIKAYNVLSTRKLPQFDKQGGDDRA